jgi:hypothetical protein
MAKFEMHSELTQSGGRDIDPRWATGKRDRGRAAPVAREETATPLATR